MMSSQLHKIALQGTIYIHLKLQKGISGTKLGSKVKFAQSKVCPIISV
jgi:hypothetical protein